MKQINQKGISLIIISIAAAIVLVVIGIIYGYFIFSGGSQTKEAEIPKTVPLTQEDPLQSKVGTPDCPELDYTGCDNTGNFMTWEDDGLR